MIHEIWSLAHDLGLHLWINRVPSDENIADLLTKSLTEHKTIKFRCGMMGSPNTVICNAVVVAYQQTRC